MASIEKRPDGRWRARWREVPGGPQKAHHFGRKVDAERFLAGVQADLLRGEYIAPEAGRATVREYGERWQSVQVWRPTTVAQVESHFRRHVYPRIGDRPMSSVRASDVQAFVQALTVDLAPSTVETIYRHVAAMFRAAVRDRVLARTPCDRITLPKADTSAKVVPLELDQVEAIAGRMPARWQALVWVGAGLGLRQGEALGLTVDRVDFLRRQVTVDRQLITVGAGPPAFGPPKTKASFRTVPLPEAVAVALSEHLRRFPVGEDGLLFTTAKGAPVRRQRLADAWRVAAASAGVPKGTGFHATRHFYASLLIRHGESVTTVQHRLGHASASETLDTYAHLWPDSEDRTRNAIDLVFGAPSEDQLRTEVGGGEAKPQVRAGGDGESACRRGSVRRLPAPG